MNYSAIERSLEIERMESPAQVESCDMFYAEEIEKPVKRSHLKFTIATTYLFRVAHGGSSLPRKSGPAIGMETHHFDSYDEVLYGKDDCPRGKVRKFNHLERIELLKDADYSLNEIASFCKSAVDLRQHRLESLNECPDEPCAVKRKRVDDTSFKCRGRIRVFNDPMIEA